MANRSATMKVIEEEISRLARERDALTHKIEGLQLALRLARGEGQAPPAAPEATRQRRGGVKETVLDLISEAAETGMTPPECVAAAKAKRGIELDRGSVSSLLSRLKKDGVLFYDGSRYRLKEYAGPRQAA